jgi:putative solute:sodium symporter small subunit
MQPSSTHVATAAWWRANLILVSILLAVWLVVSLGCGVWWADTLNQWMLPGTAYPLGFWFAQQGGIVVFVLLILVYATVMNRLDRRHAVALKAEADHE